MGPTITFRTLPSRVGAVLVAALAVVILVTALGQGYPLLANLGWVFATLLVAALGWALLWRPLVRVSDGGVDVVNILTTTHVPWPDFEEVRARWSLEVITRGGRRISSWAVPAQHGPRVSTGQRTPGARSGQAAGEAITDRHQALRAAGHLSGSTLGTVAARTRWDWPVIGLLGGLAALTVIFGLLGAR